MIGFSTRTHFNLYLTGLFLLAAALPLSIFMISVAEITLTVNWILEGNFRQKWTIIKERKTVAVISLFYLVHLLGMIYTSDFNWGFHDLRIKLPMLVLPLVIGTSPSPDSRNLGRLLNIFLVALLINSILTTYRFFSLGYFPLHTMADASNLLSYIRLSLMLNLAIFSIFHLLQHTRSNLKWLYIPAIVWLIVFLFLIHSLTGVVIFVVVSLILLFRAAVVSKNFMLRWFMLLSAITFLLLTGAYLTNAYSRFFSFDRVDPASIDKVTLHGNIYCNDFSSKYVENGHYTNLYICEPELREAWNKRSRFAYDSLNRCGEALKYPLIRYLTSKGLRKDEEGVKQLTEKDVRNIEWGMTNYIFADEYGIYPRIYTAFWELYNYHIGANPTGFSISQRIEADKTAWHIIKKDFWLGVGTGDVCQAFEKQYQLDHSRLALKNRIRAHDQWITFFLTFGCIGLFIIGISLFVPVFIEKKLSNYLFLLIFLIGFLSFLNEDTLETQAGISFFAFFYAVFLFCETPIPLIANKDEHP